MNLAPLLAAPLPIVVHVATVVPAFGLGLWQFVGSRKGSGAHRALGFAYLALMTTTAIVALWIHTPSFASVAVGPFRWSWIHLFVPLTLYGVVRAVLAIRARDIEAHRRALIGNFVGALVIAGAFAFTPGRIMYAIVFG